MRFSDLANRFSQVAPNAFTQQLDAMRSRGVPLLDLVSPALYENQLTVRDESVDEMYDRAVKRSRSYRPEPRGHAELRESISQWYRRRGENVDPSSIFVTPGSSLAYLLLFRLLGDQRTALCPRPGYPLFEDIAAIANWNYDYYSLAESERWRTIPAWIENRISDAIGAVCVVSPHNPTGAMLDDETLTQLGSTLSKFQLPLIFDEVFCEFRYVNDGGVDRSQFVRPAPRHGFPLYFIVNGMSKMFGLPGHKVGWIVCGGNDSEAVTTAIRTLEHLADTFLATGDIAQQAANELLAGENGSAADAQIDTIAQRLATQRRTLLDSLERHGWRVQHPPQAGVYLPLTIPDHISGEQFCIKVLTEEQMIIHPGYFYDLPADTIVLTWLADCSSLERGAAALSRMRNQLEFSTHTDKPL